MPQSAEWFAEHPFARLSFSRLATYERCPAWYRFAYVDWHRAWSIPVQRVGHAVQEALQRTFDATPAADVTLDALSQRAGERALAHFRKLFAEAKVAHEADPNGLGPFDLSEARYAGYVRRGLEWHIAEVAARLARRHPRTGAALSLPEAASVAEAWAAVRPWHAGGERDLEVVPAGHFQGQYDLVYSWTGGRRIVDLKASAGTSPFSTEITRQLNSYAWMERAMGRGRPEGLEAWFLGSDAPRTYAVPSEAELDEFAADLNRLLERSIPEEEGARADPTAFEPDPAPLAHYPPQNGDPSAWCQYCPAAYSCPRVKRVVPEAPADDAPILQGMVLGVGEARMGKKLERRFTLVNSQGTQSQKWAEADLARFFPAGFRAGATVRIEGLKPWRPPGGGFVRFYPQAQTRLTLLSAAPAVASPDPDTLSESSS